MIARYEWRLRQPKKTISTGNSLGSRTILFIAAVCLLLGWLVYHYIARPNWISELPPVVAEAVGLIEAASILTAIIVFVIVLWRVQRRKRLAAKSITTEDLYSLSPEAFEQYVADLFRKKDIPLVKRMRNAGCKSIVFSIENASPEILKAMNKKMRIDRVVDHCEALQDGGITPFTSIIFGYPQETPETIKMTLDLCERANIFPSVGFLQPLPSTPIYDWAVRQGFIEDELAYLMQAGDRQDFHINLTKIPTDEFIDTVVSSMEDLAKKMGLEFDNPLKTGVYQKSKRTTAA